MRDIEELLNRLKHVTSTHTNEWIADCPCPSHQTPSAHLSIKLNDNKILLHCFGSDSTEEITKTLGLTIADLFIDHQSIPKPISKKIVATYDYQDEMGNLLFQVVRFEPKDFRQRHKNSNSEWVWGTKGIRKVLYHLPEIQLAGSDTIYLVEGEKDADKLWEWGQVATTSPDGAANWNREYAQYLWGKKVIIIPDNDGPGMTYAKDAALSLIGKASVGCILLPKPAKDISDWLEQGGNIDELAGMEQDISSLLDKDKPEYEFEGNTVIWHKEIAGRLLTFKAETLRSERTGIHGRATILCDYSLLAWSFFNFEKSEDRVRLSNLAYKQIKGELRDLYSEVDLKRDFDIFCAGVWDFYLSSYSPEMIQGSETPAPLKYLLKPYIIEGGGTIIFAAPGRGKSFSALLWAISINNGINKFWQTSKAPVLFINLERSRESIKRRLSLINKVLELPATKPLLILNARGKSLADVIAPCQRMIDKLGIKLIFLDSISRAGYGDLTENSPANAIIDSLSSLCNTWVAMAHTPRSDESHIFGGIMFEAGADIVVRISSEISKEGTLGVGYEITKSNDIARPKQEIWAMEFNDTGLAKVRQAKAFEFPEVEGKAKKEMEETIKDFILNQDSGDATATQIFLATGFSRSGVCQMLNHSDQFVKTRKVKRNQYFGVREN